MRQRLMAWLGIGGVVFVVGLMFGIAFLLPIVQEARHKEAREKCSANLKQIGAALLAYEKEYKTLPPAFTVDSKGNPLHSWRSLILPYLGEKELYDKIDFQKGWTDPANDAASQSSVAAYECSESTLEKGLTSYKALVHPKAMFTGAKGLPVSSCTDDPSRTALIFESDQSDAVHWMEPQDGTLEEFKKLSLKRSAPSHQIGHHVLMVDGTTQFLNRDDTAEERVELGTRSGGK